MALASDIIRRGYRRSNLISISRTPTAAETTEALEHLNGIIQSTVGSEAGQELGDINIGGTYDQSFGDYAPANARLVLSLAAARTIKLHPQPYDGQRVAIADAGANLDTYNLILDGNGRRIETTATVTLNTASLSRQWMYRADAGNWVRITDLVAADTMPFPTEFDDYFVTALALQLAPANSASLPAEVMDRYRRAEGQIQARYRKPVRQQDSGTYGLMGQNSLGGGESSFYRGVS